MCVVFMTPRGYMAPGFSTHVDYLYGDVIGIPTDPSILLTVIDAYCDVRARHDKALEIIDELDEDGRFETEKL